MTSSFELRTVQVLDINLSKLLYIDGYRVSKTQLTHLLYANQVYRLATPVQKRYNLVYSEHSQLTDT